MVFISHFIRYIVTTIPYRIVRRELGILFTFSHVKLSKHSSALIMQHYL